MTTAFFIMTIWACIVIEFAHKTMNGVATMMLLYRKASNSGQIAVILTKTIKCHAGLLPIYEFRVYRAPAPPTARSETMHARPQAYCDVIEGKS